MKLPRLAAAALLGIVFLSSVACATPTYHLSTSVNGQGSIVPSSGDFLEGRTITVLANPSYGWVFDHWEGALSGDQSLANLKMNADKSITAYFVATNETAAQTFTQASALTTYTDDVVGFSISVPSSWEDMPIGDVGAAFLSPEPCLGFFSNCNVGKSEPSGYSLQSYYQGNKAMLEDLEDYNLIAEEEIAASGITAMEIIYTWTMQDTAIKTMQYIMVTEQADWVITFTSVPECWSTYEGTFNTMMNSFQVLE